MLLECVFMFSFGGRGTGAFCPDRRQKTEDERVCAGRKYSSRSIRLWLLHGVSLSVMSKADNRAELPPTDITFRAIGARALRYSRYSYYSNSAPAITDSGVVAASFRPRAQSGCGRAGGWLCPAKTRWHADAPDSHPSMVVAVHHHRRIA